MTTTINWFITAGTLRAAFTQDKREDGTLYWCLTDRARQSVDDLTEWLHSLHDDELPNDWRYETIVSILDALMNVDAPLDEFMDHHDLVAGISDNITDIYNGSLLQWYADMPSRVAYIDDAQSDGLIDTNTDTIARLTIGQNECIRSMCHRIIDRLITRK
jgi:hypothetical protein